MTLGERLPLGLGLTQLAGWEQSPQERQVATGEGVGERGGPGAPALAWLRASHLILMLHTSKC